ncbi:zinc finger protein [Lentzea sp. BCCO 10_0856]|uniref:Zinc finger protein n=1 Tax=Lentzea miocenica TaxID=3095431 RepID=A0ABU4TFF0_9PSEU|nr:zinc finger protein [Lentzea sp. BCCO 10_0856]MDX8036914.1 zinc finger protein [Lentzea sp. BCCO 10_0856]
MISGLTPPERFRWLPYDGARHAVPRELTMPGLSGTTLCGEPVVIPDAAPPKYPDGMWPECVACDREWRTRTGQQPRPVLPPPRSILDEPRPARMRRPKTGVCS